MQVVSITDWSKGWHPEKPEAMLQPGELAEALNIVYRESPIPEKRRGFVRLRDSFGVGRVDGLVRFKPPTAEPYWVFAWQGGLYRLYGNGTVQQIASGLTPGQDYFFEIWKDRLFVANGADGLLMWDGSSLKDLTTSPPPPPTQPAGFPIAGTVDEASTSSLTDYEHNWAAEGVVPGDIIRITSGAGAGQKRTISDIEGSKLYISSPWNTVPAVGDTFEVSTVVVEGSSAPAGPQFVIQHADRLWVARTAAEPDRLFYSRLLDYENWNDPETGIDNVIDVSVGDNQPITGLARARDVLMIFKARSLFYLQGYGPEDWVLDRISDDLGCIAPRSIVTLDSVVIWLSNRGVYMDDGTAFRRIGGPVDKWIEETLTQEQRERAIGVIAGLNYILHFPDTPEGPVCLVWNGRFETWVKWTVPAAFSVLAPRNAPTDEPGWVAGLATQALFLQGDTGGTDDGAEIVARLRTGTGGAAYQQFLLRRLAVQARISQGDTAFVQLYSGGAPVGWQKSIAPTGEMEFASVPRGHLLRMPSVAVEIRGTGDAGSQVHRVDVGLIPRRVRWHR